MHTRDLIKKGVKIEKLALVQAWAGRRQSVQRDRTGRARLGRVGTRVAETGVPDSAYNAAREVFDETQLVDLTIAVGLMNSYNRMAISFRNTPQAVRDSGHRE